MGLNSKQQELDNLKKNPFLNREDLERIRELEREISGFKPVDTRKSFRTLPMKFGVRRVKVGEKAVSFNPLSGIPSGEFVRAKKDPTFKKYMHLAPPESRAKKLIKMFK